MGELVTTGVRPAAFVLRALAQNVLDDRRFVTGAPGILAVNWRSAARDPDQPFDNQGRPETVFTTRLVLPRNFSTHVCRLDVQTPSTPMLNPRAMFLLAVIDVLRCQAAARIIAGRALPARTSR